MPPTDLHSRVADRLAEWLDETPKRIAARWTGNGTAPFAKPVRAKDALAYYERAFFNPDGTPNVQGRQSELERVGIDGYAQAMRGVLRKQREGTLAVETTETPEPAPAPAPEETY